MHASMFSLDLGSSAASRNRAQRGRALAAALAALPGFVAFIAIEAQDGTVTGLCICVDAEALEVARRKAVDWQREVGGAIHSEPAHGVRIQDPIAMGALVTGEVIVQRGF
jgi:hypothetical protein